MVSAGILPSLSLGHLLRVKAVTLAQAKARQKEKVELKETVSPGKLLQEQKAKASVTEPNINEGKI